MSDCARIGGAPCPCGLRREHAVVLVHGIREGRTNCGSELADVEAFTGWPAEVTCSECVAELARRGLRRPLP